jgi:hypothetical protein
MHWLPNRAKRKIISFKNLSSFVNPFRQFEFFKVLHLSIDF